MQTRKIITAAAIAVGLTGCADVDMSKAELEASLASCQRKNLQLQRQIEDHQVLVNDLNRQAAIAASCDWLVPLCPSSVTEQGRIALDKGYSGGTSHIFWLIFIAKLVAGGAFVASMLTGGWWLYIQLVRPSQLIMEAAQRLVDDAEQQVGVIMNRIVAGDERLALINKECSEAIEKREALQAQILAVREQQEKAEKALARTKASKAALDAAFD